MVTQRPRLWFSKSTQQSRSRAKAKVLPDASTWSPKLSELVKASQVSLLPYNLELDYDYWNYRMYVQDTSIVLNRTAHTTR